MALPGAQPGPAPSSRVGDQCPPRRSVPVLVGAALTEDYGQRPGPLTWAVLPHRARRSAQARALRRPRAAAAPAPAEASRQRREAAGRLGAAPMAAGGTALKGTARWAGDLRGALAPAWGRAGCAVRAFAPSRLVACGPARRPRAEEHLAHLPPPPGHLLEGSWQPGRPWRQPKSWPRCGQVLEFNACGQPRQEQMGSPTPCWPSCCRACLQALPGHVGTPKGPAASWVPRCAASWRTGSSGPTPTPVSSVQAGGGPTALVRCAHPGAAW